MTEKIKKSASALFSKLRFKMFLIVLFSIVVSFVLAMIINNLGEAYIEKMMTNEERISEQQAHLLLSFADFVKKNKLSSVDSAKFDEWINENPNASLTIFQESEKVLGEDESPDYKWYVNDGSTTIVRDSAFPFISQGSKVVTNSSGNTEGSVYSNYQFRVYPVRFSDGVRSVVIYNHIEQMYNSVLNFVVIASFVFSMLFIIITYTGRLLKRVNSLSQQVSVVSKGDISASVYVKGSDELSKLGADVEHMRGTLENRITSEQNAWKSNQELLTSISHDIRTPLTSLIGYSDVLVNGQFKDDEQKMRYIKLCRDKAYQLKSLTDELFRYFTVFSSPQVKVNSTKENAGILLLQLLGEPLADLKAKGYDVRETNLADEKVISVDVLLLKRVFDNIFSNINKYADINYPVEAIVKYKDGYICVNLKNHIRTDNKKVESTKIGIKTCIRLCEAMNITYSYKQEDGAYFSSFEIPVIK